MAVAYYKQHDRKPYLRAPLIDGAGQPFIVGVGETVAVLFRPVTDPTLVLRATGYVVSVAEEVTLEDGTIVAITQAIEHRWLPTGAPWGGGNHTGLVGIFDQEYEHQDAAGLPRTFPPVGYNSLIVADDIDNP